MRFKPTRVVEVGDDGAELRSEALRRRQEECVDTRVGANLSPGDRVEFPAQKGQKFEGVESVYHDDQGGKGRVGGRIKPCEGKFARKIIRQVNRLGEAGERYVGPVEFVQFGPQGLETSTIDADLQLGLVRGDRNLGV